MFIKYFFPPQDAIQINKLESFYEGYHSHGILFYSRHFYANIGIEYTASGLGWITLPDYVEG